MVTKLQAARLATASGVAVVIAHGREPDVLSRLARGEALGTLFSPTSSKLESRKRWMLSGVAQRGAVVVDEGAARALDAGHSSLLPVGVRGVQGAFSRGDIVDILDQAGRRLACGIVNYGSADIARLQGRHSAEVQALLGYDFGDEIVHRNNLVLV
jgi:glutamate 5-kinase